MEAELRDLVAHITEDSGVVHKNGSIILGRSEFDRSASVGDARVGNLFEISAEYLHVRLAQVPLNQRDRQIRILLLQMVLKTKTQIVQWRESLMAFK